MIKSLLVILKVSLRAWKDQKRSLRKSVPVVELSLAGAGEGQSLRWASAPLPGCCDHASMSQRLSFDFQRESDSPDKVGFVPLKMALSRLPILVPVLYWCEEDGG